MLLVFLQGDDSSDMKLDFTFDAELAKLTEEKNESMSPPKDLHEPPKPIPMPSQANMASPTSPATEDLNMRITSVKKIWETAMPTVYEKHSVSMAQSVSVPASQVEPESEPVEVSATPGFNTFHSAMESHAMPSSPQVSAEVSFDKYDTSVASMPEASVSLSVAMAASDCSPHSSYNETITTSSMALMAPKSSAAVSEHTNICKVRNCSDNTAVLNPLRLVHRAFLQLGTFVLLLSILGR